MASLSTSRGLWWSCHTSSLSLKDFVKSKSVILLLLENYWAIQLHNRVDPLRKIYLKHVNHNVRFLVQVHLRDGSVSLSQAWKINLNFLPSARSTNQISVLDNSFHSKPVYGPLMRDKTLHASNAMIGHGLWPSTMRDIHINIKEMITIWIPLHKCKFLRGTSVQLWWFVLAEEIKEVELLVVLDCVNSSVSGFSEYETCGSA